MFGQAKASFLVSNPREQRICTIGEAFRVLKSRIFQAKDGGRPIQRRDRYVGIWRRNNEGNWKLWMYMDNQDIADPETE
jgi:ketosteroid isomerase-like protein